MELLLLSSLFALIAYFRHVFVVNHRPDWLVSLLAGASFGMTFFVVILLLTGVLP